MYHQDMKTDEEINQLLYSSCPSNHIPNVLRLLSSFQRIRILCLLDRRELRFSQIRESLNTSSPVVTRHLSSLRRSGLITSIRRGHHTLFRIERRCEPAIVRSLLENIC